MQLFVAALLAATCGNFLAHGCAGDRLIRFGVVMTSKRDAGRLAGWQVGRRLCAFAADDGSLPFCCYRLDIEEGGNAFSLFEGILIAQLDQLLAVTGIEHQETGQTAGLIPFDPENP